MYMTFETSFRLTLIRLDIYVFIYLTLNEDSLIYM
jgi:hypothetical protein